jgi:hypothetical protein
VITSCNELTICLFSVLYRYSALGGCAVAATFARAAAFPAHAAAAAAAAAGRWRWRDDDGQRVQVATPSPCFSSCKMEPKEAFKSMYIQVVHVFFCRVMRHRATIAERATGICPQSSTNVWF